METPESYAVAILENAHVRIGSDVLQNDEQKTINKRALEKVITDLKKKAKSREDNDEGRLLHLIKLLSKSIELTADDVNIHNSGKIRELTDAADDLFALTGEHHLVGLLRSGHSTCAQAILAPAKKAAKAGMVSMSVIYNTRT